VTLRLVLRKESMEVTDNSSPFSSRPCKRQRTHFTGLEELKEKDDIRRVSLDAPPFREELPPKLDADRIRQPQRTPPKDCYQPKKHNQYVEEEEEDDSSIEVLLTVLPPTPKKKEKTPRNSNICSSLLSKSANATSPCTQSRNTSKICSRNQTSPIVQDETLKHASISVDGERGEAKLPTFENAPSSRNTATSLQSDNNAYSTDDEPLPPSQVSHLISSAYVQNLAEISHTIMNDKRWRVGPRRGRLLAWECGDDLSSVVPLARLYRPLEKPFKAKQNLCSNNNACQKLLCNCQPDSMTAVPAEAETGYSTASSDSPTQENNSFSQPNIVSSNNASSKVEKTNIAYPWLGSCETESAEDRCMHLYCRIFYRKGPWFRIDDLFCRYYAPKQANRLQVNQESYVAAPGKETFLQVRKQDFFLKDKPVASKKSGFAIRHSIIDEELFQKYIAILRLFVTDLGRLKEMGLVRNFSTEEECGKAVGTARTLLTADERRQVLAKLGGGKQQSAAPTKPRRPSFGSSKRKQPSAPVENEIWKQMCEQTSISAQFNVSIPTGSGTSKKGKSVLLPVSRHVNQVLIGKLATRIVQACSSSDYVKSSVMKSYAARVKNAVVIALNGHQKVSLSESSLETAIGRFETCIRLREAPLRSLQRCARLYLCATSGPGQMRSDGGTNGWKSIKELDRNLVFSNTKLKDAAYASNVEPPGAHSWHSVVYPGLQHRFGLASFHFQNAYEHLFVDGNDSDDSSDAPEQIFYSRNAFLCWELVAEWRSHADYLIEVNELLLYNERRRAREDGAGEKENSVEVPSALDFLGVLSSRGRNYIVCVLLFGKGTAASQSKSSVELNRLLSQIDQDVSQLYSSEVGCTLLKTECEEVLCVMALIIKNVLAFRTNTIAEDELLASSSRPWLRHLSWEACAAYILWDAIPILERRGFYAFAVQSLDLLVQGRVSVSLQVADQQMAYHPSNFARFNFVGENKKDKLTVAFVHFLLSRRARGKAFDRLAIDMTHLIRRQEKSSVAHKGKSKKETKKPLSAVQDFVASYTASALRSGVENASVAFSAIRTLARRLKQPLSKSLENLPCAEALVLGLRLEPPGGPGVDKKKYIDWEPTTDRAVANSIAVGECLVGRRCSFVGHEDEQSVSALTRSLNVEQLAMGAFLVLFVRMYLCLDGHAHFHFFSAFFAEFYHSGRLPPPADGDSIEVLKGGYKGWHDEGGMVRALFRVLAFDVLGMDHSNSDFSWLERHTIHLSPYQGSPFDLHVGYELADPVTWNGKVVHCNRGFYLRRQNRIEIFLSKLEKMRNAQEASDLVWESLAARRSFMIAASRKDPALEKDVLQCRTLSALAAGFGGRLLASIFRCMFFDYRHYSGGLPDLLLVRAKLSGTEPCRLVDLGEWIGESFDAKYLAELEAQHRTSLLVDRDDDFLGCSKVGDSGGGGSSRGRTASKRSVRQEPRSKDATSTGQRAALPVLPPKLVLSHNGSQVEVECMFVEVKSSNDRLDARQTDWLNILDRSGNARVCKFGEGGSSDGATKQ